MRKLIDTFGKLWQGFGFVRNNARKRVPDRLPNRLCLFEPLENRTLLSLTWSGYDDPQSKHLDTVWSKDSARTNWINDAGYHVSFQDGENVIFPSVPTPSLLNVKISPYFDGINTYSVVKPEKILFTGTGYDILADTGCSISANNTTLTIQVNQKTITSDVIATISAPITNPTGGITQLGVDATGSGPDSGIDTETGNYYPTGTLILKGTNTYGADDLTTNYTLIKGYSYLKSDYTWTYTGGVLVAGSPDALPKNDNDVFRYIKVESAGTLAVENDGTLNGTNGKWTNNTIPTLFSSNPNFEGNATLRSNFGIWVDEGKSFEYMQTIPGNSGGSENLNENFVKLGVGTLTVSGDNRRESPHFGYPGTTSVNKGTLITTKPEALPRYGVSGQVMVRNTIPDPDVSNMNKFFECSC